MRKLIGALVVLLSVQSYALVDMKNANYTNTWIDMEVPGSGYDLKIVRTYNSRSLFNGMFGFGWCSDFETSLEIMPEGNLKVKECGGGQEVTFSPKEISRKEIDNTINQIVLKAKADKRVNPTDDYIAKLKGILLKDDASRAEFAHHYGVSTPVKEGTKFLANGREVEYFTFNKTFYTRNLADGTSQRFNLQGKLTAQYDKNGNVLKFDYDKDLIAKIEDGNGRRLTFKYGQNKKVKSILGPSGLTSEYDFAKIDDLSSVKNAWGKKFAYEYDELHNLTKATWPDNTFIALKYDIKRDWVISFTDRDKCAETYDYQADDKTPELHYWSTVKKTCGKEVTAENKYEFWHKTRADGKIFLQRVKTDVSGNATDISYDEKFGKPLSITKNLDRVNYDYYDDGLVKVKSTPLMKMTYSYEPTVKKVSKVVIQFTDPKGKVVGTKSSDFTYDAKGNLSTAKNSDGQKVNLTYDNRGRIASITDQAKKIVKLDYDEKFGKPIQVTRPDVGKIQVTYKPSGEIAKVDSKDGPTVALEVANTFNNLLDIISPATAEMYL